MVEDEPALHVCWPASDAAPPSSSATDYEGVYEKRRLREVANTLACITMKEIAVRCHHTCERRVTHSKSFSPMAVLLKSLSAGLIVKLS